MVGRGLYGAEHGGDSKGVKMVRFWAAVVVVFLASDAFAVVVCAPRAQVLARLGAAYSETPRGRGISTRGAVLELLTAPSGGWTVIVTRPSGLTCLVDAGEDWEVIPAAPPRPSERGA